MATVKPKLREYEYEQLVTGKVGKALTGRQPAEVLRILLAELRRITDADENGVLWITRGAIEEANDGAFERPLNSIVDGVRDALMALTDVNAEAASEVLQQMLEDTHPIYRRLALFTLTERPHLLRSMREELILPAEIFDHGAFHEQARLLRERFDELPTALRERVQAHLDSLVDGVDDPDGERLMRRAWRLVNVLPEQSLTDKGREFKEQKAEDLGGLMENPLFEVWMSGVRAATAPATATELRDLVDGTGYDRLLDALRNPTQHFDIQWYQDAELLWDQVAALVTENPEGLLELAPNILVTDYPGAWRYFDAYEQLSKQGREFDWKPILTAISRLAREENATPTYWSSAHVLKHAAFSNTNRVATEDLDLLAEAAERILESTCTLLANYAEIENDLGFHQLNDPAGTSADALIGVCFRRAYDASSDEQRASNLPDEPRMDARSRELLERALAEGWGGIELRHSVGQMLHLVLWSDSSWLSHNVNELVPTNIDRAAHIGAWRGFWAGHLRTNRLYESVMESLFERYELLVADAASANPVILMEAFHGHDRDALGDHLRVGWLRGYDGFGQDGLFGKFHEGVSDEARANVVRGLVPDLRHGYETEDAAWRDRVLGELFGFWDSRLAHVAESVAAERSKEVSAFCLWLSELREPLESTESRLRLMLPRIDRRGFECELIVEHLASKVDASPDAVARLLPLVVEELPDGPEGPWHAQKVPPVVERAWELTEEGASRQELTRAASRLLERFGIDMRDRLGL